jgi:membrane protease YdiL (CAAX protease family)
MPWDFALIFLVLAIVLPWKGHARMRKLLARPQFASLERVSLYASTILFQWIAVIVVAWRGWARGLTPVDLGLVSREPTHALLAGMAGAILFGALQWLNLRRMGRLPVEARGLMQSIAVRILPRSGIERLVFFALSVTAALCEEFLYRGFAVAALLRLGWPSFAVILASAVLFGLGHIYQGRGGLVSSLLLGVLFGFARMHYQSLVPAVLWHGSVDMVAGLVGPRFLQIEDCEVHVG